MRRHLASLGVPFHENQAIVRGLDYYNHTAFEFTTTALGAQGTVLAGGRYDELVATLGGPPTPGVGWAAGIERLALLGGGAGAMRPVVTVIPLGDETEPDAVRLLAAIRRAGIRAEMSYRGNARRRFERANRIEAAAAVVLGEAERTRGVAAVKDLRTGAQDEIALGQVPDRLREILRDHAA